MRRSLRRTRLPACRTSRARPRPGGCGGDRFTRHNLVRDVVHSAANNGANLATILEKPGLLIPRNTIDDDRPSDPDPPDPSTSSRLLSPTSLAPRQHFRLGRVSQELVPQYSLPAHPSWHFFLPLVLEAVGGVSDQRCFGSLAKANGPILSVAPTPAPRSRSATQNPTQGKRARDRKGGTGTNWLSMSVPRHVSLGRVVICCVSSCPWSWPVREEGCFCLHQETDHADTRISYFFNLSRGSLRFSLAMSLVLG